MTVKIIAVALLTAAVAATAAVGAPLPQAKSCRLFPADMDALLAAVPIVLREMGVASAS